MRLLKVVLLMMGLSAFIFAQDQTFNVIGFAESQLEVDDAPWLQDHSGGARGIISGVDLDQDGKQEIWVTDYSYGCRVHAFEASGTDTLALIWSSAQVDTGYVYSNARWVQTGDLDGDGNGEVIFFAGDRWWYPDDPESAVSGMYIYEWDGSDNGFGTEPAFFFSLFTGLNDTIRDVRIEHFSVGDLDGDGQDEMVLAINGASDPLYGSKTGTNFSEDRFTVLSIDGDIGSGFESVVEEYSVAPRDVDKDGTRENALGGGSPLGALIVDTDGDGKKEVAAFSWNSLSLFFFESDTADSYTLGDTTYYWLNTGHGDEWTLAPTAGDIDGDGDDEVFVAGYGDGRVYVIDDQDGDATHLIDSTETACIYTGANVGGSVSDLPYFDTGPTLFFGGSAAGTGDIAMFKFTGTDPLDSLSWTVSWSKTDSAAGGTAHKIYAGADLDDDNYGEIVLGYQSVADSVEFIDTTVTPWDTSMVAKDKRWIIRVAEYSDEALVVRPITVITPADYKLGSAYPNPFNPITTIEYQLPLAGEISLIVYNLRGQEVIRLVDSEIKKAGSHQVVWNGLDAKGLGVASGTYLYVMRFGNFQKSKRVTFLK
ncbi:FG-GAP-like repeat-containing protein [Candidatus Neomarinimicrobiota bacterium]